MLKKRPFSRGSSKRSQTRRAIPAFGHRFRDIAIVSSTYWCFHHHPTSRIWLQPFRLQRGGLAVVAYFRPATLQCGHGYSAMENIHPPGFANGPCANTWGRHHTQKPLGLFYLILFQYLAAKTLRPGWIQLALSDIRPSPRVSAVTLFCPRS